MAALTLPNLQEFKSTLLFARMFFKNPRMLGSVFPSSRYLAEHLLEKVAWESARVVVEYGPGVGNLTRQILERMPPDAVLVAIETNEEFVKHMRQDIRDPRLHVVHGSAGDVRRILARFGVGQVDCIISGIPYSTLPAHVREQILYESYRALRPAGGFLVYQFTSAVRPHLQRIFGRVRQEFEPRNILPARIFVCSR